MENTIASVDIARQIQLLEIYLLDNLIVDLFVHFIFSSRTNIFFFFSTRDIFLKSNFLFYQQNDFFEFWNKLIYLLQNKFCVANEKQIVRYRLRANLVERELNVKVKSQKSTQRYSRMKLIMLTRANIYATLIK